MRSLAICLFVLPFCLASAVAQTPTKPQATAPENVTVGEPKYATRAERAAAKKKKADCQKQAKDQKLDPKARRAFVKDCIAK
jgi:hypothetical protein